MKTYLPSVDEIKKERKWFLIDVEGKNLGRVATLCAKILQGKNKAYFTNHLDAGDNIIIINAAKINLTGSKMEQKKYYTHSGHPGNLKEISAKKLLEKNPVKILEDAIWGMLAKNKHRKNRFKRLRVFKQKEHTHTAQNPEIIKF